MPRRSCQHIGRAGQTVRLTELVTAARGAAYSTGDASRSTVDAAAFRNAQRERNPTNNGRSSRAVLAMGWHAARAATKASRVGRNLRVRRSTVSEALPKDASRAPQHLDARQIVPPHCSTRALATACATPGANATGCSSLCGVHVAAHLWSAANDGAALPM